MTADIIMNWMLQTGLDISILIALILIFRRPFGRMFGAAAAYSLWLLPLVRLFMPEVPIVLPRPIWMMSPKEAVPQIIEFSSVLPVTPAPVSDPVNWQTPAFVLWLSVALVWLGFQIVRQHQFVRGILHDSSDVSQNTQRQLDNASKQLELTRRPLARLSSTNAGPLVTGIRNPVIILPHNFETDFTERQQFFALTHELAHIKRKDLLAAYATLLFRALNWPNPLVHIGAAKFRADQEAACDAYVLKTVGGGAPTKQSYAETLIHSARLSRASSASMGTGSTNPLCLTIHHPLKERLMTMKTPTSKSKLLSRVGVAAFLATGLALTAPISIAAGQDAPKVETKMKKVIKMVENNDGVETTKTLEIIEEDGVTTVYSIDEHGNKTVVQEDEIGEFPMMGGDLDIMVMEDGQPGEKRIKIFGDEIVHSGDGQHAKVFVKRMKKGDQGQSFDMDQNVMVFSDVMGEGAHASVMVEAARNLLDQAETMNGGQKLSSKAKRKLEKARKALDEAQAALDAE